MEIEIKIENGYTSPKVIVLTQKMTDEVNALIARISAEEPRVIAGIKDDTLKLLEQEEIIRVCSGDGKVFAVTEDGEYQLRCRLYEMEEKLDRKSFVRISGSEIINLKQVKNFDLSFVGTICVKMKDGSVTYVSRRHVSKIKKILGV